MELNLRNRLIKKMTSDVIKYVNQVPAWDIHIDEVSRKFKNKETWWDASLELLKPLSKALRGAGYETNLCVRLVETYKKDSIPKIRTNRSLDYTPPSFYFFKKNEVKNQQTEFSDLKKINIPYLGISEYDVYFQQELDGSLYRRWLWIVPRDMEE